MDYQGNAKKVKLGDAKPEKTVERVTATEIIVKKKSLGRKFRDLFIEADFRGVVRYIGYDVLIPALRNMIADAGTKGIERVIYGQDAVRRRNYGAGPRTTYTSYSTPVSRGYPGPPASRFPGGAVPALPSRAARPAQEDFIITSREEADLILEAMNDIIEQYEVVTVADLYELTGLPSNHIDHKWGWGFLGGVQVRQIREGYLIDFPPAEPIA